MTARIRRRRRAERRFRFGGALAVAIAAAFLVHLLATVAVTGWSSFCRTEIRVPVRLDPAVLGVAAAGATPSALAAADYPAAVRRSAASIAGSATTISDAAWLAVRSAVIADPALVGRTVEMWLPATGNLDQLAKGNIDLRQPAADLPVSTAEIAAWERLDQAGRLRTAFNPAFLGSADSVDPEVAGIRGALTGSLLTIGVTLLLSFPVGVLAALWLEEFSRRSVWTDILDVSIGNLAAVPPILFGLLGLALFLDRFGLPRSAPLAGGLTLALMTLPVIVIASRASVRAVPPSIRDAALGIGASRTQAVFHHVLPQAFPGILTGTILAVGRALGETAPLLLIGMRAFVVAPPAGIDAPATVLPVQIFLWSDNVARGFVEKTAGAILVLLLVLLSFNAAAVMLRRRAEARR
jgi:phosphate transport system permease protein